MDLPGWQAIYEELGDQGLEVISVAQDTGGEAAAGEWFDRARLRAVLSEHDAGARDHGRLLWSLLVLEQWRRRHDVRGLAS